MKSTDILDALTPVVEALERLGVQYHISGSIASSYYGAGRSTLDVDLVADLTDEHVLQFVVHLSGTYYVDTSMIRDAIQRRSSFNVIHLATMMKIDLFIQKEGVFDRIASNRVQQDTLSDEPGARLFTLASPEDVVLRKLEWYKAGGEMSERQWNDVLGVLKVQSAALDVDYMDHWANVLGVGDLLERAWQEALR